jgi:hypothetical protein
MLEKRGRMEVCETPGTGLQYKKKQRRNEKEGKKLDFP